MEQFTHQKDYIQKDSMQHYAKQLNKKAANLLYKDPTGDLPINSWTLFYKNQP